MAIDFSKACVEYCSDVRVVASGGVAECEGAAVGAS